MLRELLDAYVVPESRFDEMLASAGVPRPHWDAFLRSLVSRQGEEIGETLSLMEREIRENGITYNVYADPQGADRPWESTRCRCCCRRTSGKRSSPASRSAPIC